MVNGAQAPALGPIHMREIEVRERRERLRNQKKMKEREAAEQQGERNR